MKLLLVEDNADQAAFIQQGMSEHGHVTDLATHGRHGLMLAIDNRYDLIITDRMMPEMDGLQMLKALRASGNQTPVLILSALDSVDDRVTGLRSGGDDYLVKPFAFSELLARAEILSQRRSAEQSSKDDTTLRLDDLRLDRLTHSVQRGEQTLNLSNREYQILEFLMANIGRVVTRTLLIERVWGMNFDPQTNVVDVHISRLRKKVDIPGHKPLLHTVRGAGYRFQVLPS